MQYHNACRELWYFFRQGFPLISIELMDIVPIGDYISSICSNTFESIVKDPDHRLLSLVPFSGPSSYALRCNRRFAPPKFKTDRFKNSFIIRSYPVSTTFISSLHIYQAQRSYSIYLNVFI
jgi:hypothetical protein